MSTIYFWTNGWEKFSTRNLFFRRVQVSISPTRAEGYPFVKRYPYRMLRRATWLKAASCVPPILPSIFLFTAFYVQYLMRHARKYSLPTVIDSHFSGNGARKKGRERDRKILHFSQGFQRNFSIQFTGES